MTTNDFEGLYRKLRELDLEGLEAVRESSLHVMLLFVNVEEKVMSEEAAMQEISRFANTINAYIECKKADQKREGEA